MRNTDIFQLTNKYPPIVGRTYLLTTNKFNFKIVSNEYICFGFIVLYLCFSLKSYNCICDFESPTFQGPNLPHQHFLGAQFAPTKIYRG